METSNANANGDVLSNEVFKTNEELMDGVSEALSNDEVKTIKVTKDVVQEQLTDQRKNFINKKIRKLERKHKALVDELQKG